MLLAKARQLTGSRERAEDLYQDTAVRALTKAHVYSEQGQLKSWLCRVMHNLWASQMRKAHYEHLNRERSHARPDDRVVEPEATPDVDYHSPEYKELRDMVLRSMSLQYASALLAVGSGLKYQQAAEKLGVPLGTVMSRLHRARQVMQKELTEVAA